MVREAGLAAAAALVALVIGLRVADGSASALVQSWYEPVLLATVVGLLALSVLAAIPVLRSPEPLRVRFGRTGLVQAGFVVVVAGAGVAFKPEPLAGTDLESDPLTVTFSASASNADPARRNVYQWAYEFQNSAPSSLLGQPVDVVAFVFHGKEPVPGRFFAARFVVACCVADAQGFTVPVAWPGAASLPADAWVRVRGAITVAPDGALAIAARTVEPIDAPSSPYIYP
ncbi:MAG: TIGR03943 family putative permease subunit [Dehalococcoidia bacterium]